jgi:hypothetical protein
LVPIAAESGILNNRESTFTLTCLADSIFPTRTCGMKKDFKLQSLPRLMT